VVGIGGSRSLPVLRRAGEHPCAGALSLSSDLALVAFASAEKPENQDDLGANEATDRPLDPTGPHLPPLPSETTWRHYLRQEPSKLVAYAASKIPRIGRSVRGVRGNRHVCSFIYPSNVDK